MPLRLRHIYSPVILFILLMNAFLVSLHVGLSSEWLFLFNDRLLRRQMISGYHYILLLLFGLVRLSKNVSVLIVIIWTLGHKVHNGCVLAKRAHFQRLCSSSSVILCEIARWSIWPWNTVAIQSTHGAIWQVSLIISEVTKMACAFNFTGHRATHVTGYIILRYHHVNVGVWRNLWLFLEQVYVSVVKLSFEVFAEESIWVCFACLLIFRQSTRCLLWWDDGWLFLLL